MRTLTLCCDVLHVLYNLLVIFWTCCSAENQYASFDTFTNCDRTFSVDRQSQVFVTGERNSGGSLSSSVNTCLLMFKARRVNDRLCAKIDKLKFKNDKLELNYYAELDPQSVAPDKTFKFSDQNSAPSEFCSDGREISLELKPVDHSASVRDVDIDIKIHNMHGNTRIGDMDRDCGTTYDIFDSMISVNLFTTPTVNLTSPCKLYFRYTGSDSNYTLCLKFTQRSHYCGYTLKVLDGTADDFVAVHEYTCENSQPAVWCAEKKSLFLELIRTDETANEPSSVFNILVKDGIKGEVVFPEESSSSLPIPIWAIVLIVVATIIIILAVIIFFVKKSKGYSVPQEQHEAQKL